MTACQHSQIMCVCLTACLYLVSHPTTASSKSFYNCVLTAQHIAWLKITCNMEGDRSLNTADCTNICSDSSLKTHLVMQELMVCCLIAWQESQCVDLCPW